MTINLGWKILQTCTWQISFVKWLFSALKKTPNFIGQGQILFVAEFPQVFDLGADGKGMSYVASLTQDRITQRAASTARYEYFILLKSFCPVVLTSPFSCSVFFLCLSFFIASFVFHIIVFLSYGIIVGWISRREGNSLWKEEMQSSKIGNGFFLRMLVGFLY